VLNRELRKYFYLLQGVREPTRMSSVQGIFILEGNQGLGSYGTSNKDDATTAAMRRIMYLED
jgi:hypothetical protein